LTNIEKGALMICETPDCYGRKERKARKAHRCCECHGTIQPGEKYHYHHGVWDGEAKGFKVCIDCDALRAECDRDARYDECTPFEGLYEAMDGHRIKELTVRFAEILRKRGATVPKWMEEETNESVLELANRAGR
jgi:hypothetical protein